MDNVLSRRLCIGTDNIWTNPQHLSTHAIRTWQSWKVPPAKGRRLHLPFIPNLDRRPYLLIIIKRTTKRTQAKAASPTAMETWKKKTLSQGSGIWESRLKIKASPCQVNLSLGSYPLLQTYGYQLWRRIQAKTGLWYRLELSWAVPSAGGLGSPCQQC